MKKKVSLLVLMILCLSSIVVFGSPAVCDYHPEGVHILKWKDLTVNSVQIVVADGKDTDVIETFNGYGYECINCGVDVVEHPDGRYLIGEFDDHYYENWFLGGKYRFTKDHILSPSQFQKYVDSFIFP